MLRQTRVLGFLLVIAVVVLTHYLFTSPTAVRPSVSSSDQAIATRRNAHSSPLSHRHPSLRLPDSVKIDSRGLVAYDPRDQVHPIERLIERGRKLAEAMQMRIDTEDSLPDAVKDYERAYGMKPPRGFDKW